MKVKLTVWVAIFYFTTQSCYGQFFEKTSVPAILPTFEFKFKLGSSSVPGYPYPPHISTAGSGLTSVTPSYDNQFTCTFIELGDGNFSFDEITNHYYESLIYPLVYKTTGLYDDDPRPPRHLIELPNNSMTLNSPGDQSTAKLTMNPILASRSVGVMANINSVLAKDTMIYIVTYRLKMTDDPNSYIKFFYNNIDAFELVNPSATITQGMNTIPFVRTYFGETVSVESSKTDDYLYAMRISNLIRDSLEHHVFITMIPKEGLSRESIPAIKEKNGASVIDQQNLTANVLVELYNSSDVKTGDDIKKYPVSDKSHDPNYIEMYPRCLSLPKKDEKIRIHVHCQNVGKGDAKVVKLIVKLPGGTRSSDIDRGSIEDKAPFGVLGVWDYSDPYFLVVKFDLTKFLENTTASTHTLNGSISSPMYLSDENTMADIWFTLKTNSTVPNMLESEAEIYFQNNDIGNSWNEAVKTNKDFVMYSDCCNCRSKQNSCGCSKNRSRFWRWLFCKKC